MKITQISTFILHVPVTNQMIADSMHRISHWGAPGVIIHTDAGIVGYGYTGTHAHLATDRLITDCISNAYVPLLIGEDPIETQYLWQKLFHFPPTMWVGRGGIVHLAQSAIDVALWDIKAKSVGLPLWKLLGGNRNKKIEAYNTDGGWLNWTEEQLVADARRLVEEAGFRGLKIKVGKENGLEDLKRIEAVRKTIGPDIRLMVDANGRWSLDRAIHTGRYLADFNIDWLEEPLWYDDVIGHAALAQKISTPIALGEQLYSLDHFRNFLNSGAVHFVQPDAVRLAGITEWWEVADLARAYRLPVVPHVGDMMQIHIQLAFAHASCTMLEYIPWLLDCFEEPARIQNGQFATPELPGAGTTIVTSAIEKYNVL